MTRAEIRKQNVAKLCVALKKLHDYHKTTAMYGLINYLKNLNVKNVNQVISVLNKKGIVQSVRGKTLWITMSEPNLHMAEAIYDAINKKYAKKVQVALNINEEAIAVIRRALTLLERTNPNKKYMVWTGAGEGDGLILEFNKEIKL